MIRTRTRFAPSPTGFLHIGGLRTALYTMLQARHDGGDFILRIEDTDRTRFVEGSMESLCRSLAVCGVIPDEGVWLDSAGSIIQRGKFGPYIQSEARDRHRAYAEKLLRLDKAYVCFCSEQRLTNLRDAQQKSGRPTMYDGLCRSISLEEANKKIQHGESHVIRLKLPRQGTVSFVDAIRGEITFDWSLVDDQVIIKSDGFPTYHLASTADDQDMEISHVIRGEEWISSTPKHLFLIEAMGWRKPIYAHLPLLLNPDRSKLSKRQGDVAVEDYLTSGYLPDALLNFIALLGWNPFDAKEIYTMEEMANAFRLSEVHKAGAVFNLEKLDWMNREYLKRRSPEAYLELVRPHIAGVTDDSELADRVLLMIRERIVRPKDVIELAAPYLSATLDYESVSIAAKNQSSTDAITRLHGVIELFSTFPEKDFDAIARIEERVKAMIVANDWTNGDTLWPLRVALSGQEKSPTPFELASALGKTRAIERLQAAQRTLRAKDV